jgi:NAD(P)-dependent dehydrogenase (short-subunit alcohol dehydrogenase family)
MAQRLEGRAALVTGSTSNIGRAIALALAAEGAAVIVTGRNAQRGADVVEHIRNAGGRAEFVTSDLDGTALVSQRLAAAAATIYGPIKILVNNAGIYPPAPTLAVDDSTLAGMWAINVQAPFLLTASVIPGMIAGGGGVVINLGSWSARLGIPTGAAYAATKGAMETLTRAWAAEFGSQGVRVNAISPGVTFDADHPYVAVAGSLMESSPLGGVVDPAAIGAAAVYLASDDARSVHGTVLDVDGGRSSVLVAAR